MLLVDYHHINEQLRKVYFFIFFPLLLRFLLPFSSLIRCICFPLFTFALFSFHSLVSSSHDSLLLLFFLSFSTAIDLIIYSSRSLGLSFCQNNTKCSFILFGCVLFFLSIFPCSLKPKPYGLILTDVIMQCTETN